MVEGGNIKFRLNGKCMKEKQYSIYLLSALTYFRNWWLRDTSFQVLNL